jgi:phage tail sheath protein FI
MSDFHHGIEHVNLPTDVIPVNDVRTAVIGLVGTAEKGAINKLILCRSEKDDAQFGSTGTIPESLRAIRMQDSSKGSALVFVVNVAAADATPAPADIIGAVDEIGVRTGMKLFETADQTFGFAPMIYIAPRFSALAAVRQELIRITEKDESMSYHDSPDGMTLDEALQSRGTEGVWKTLTEGCKALYPHFLVPNPKYVEGAVVAEGETPEPQYFNVPMSAFCAGLRAKVDLEEGWHVSSSNHRITGIEGLDVPVTFSITDKTCDANMLNAIGITTAVNMFGGGIVEWGNYTAGLPTNSDPAVFECVRRTRAIIKRSLDMACAQFIDVKQIKKVDIDIVRNTVDGYLRTLIGAGKIVDGKCYYRPESNPVEELAKGHITFDNVFTPAIPMQQMTFTYKMDISKLSTIA